MAETKRPKESEQNKAFRRARAVFQNCAPVTPPVRMTSSRSRLRSSQQHDEHAAQPPCDSSNIPRPSSLRLRAFRGTLPPERYESNAS